MTSFWESLDLFSPEVREEAALVVDFSLPGPVQPIRFDDGIFVNKNVILTM